MKTITPISVKKFWEHVNKDGPIHPTYGQCWEWTGLIMGNGYGRTGGHEYAHRMSWKIHFGEVTDELFVLHKCDNRSCVNPDHLFLGTQLDNMRDAKDKGRTATGSSHGWSTHPEAVLRGEDHGRAVFTNEQVAEIKRLYRRGSRQFGQYGLARKFGVSRSAICNIITGIRWKHVS